MKKIFFTLVLLVQVVSFSFAGTKKASAPVNAQPLHENVKVFRQAGTSTEVIETLSTADKVEFVRQHNSQWAIVTVNGKAGYVLLTEIAPLKVK